MAIKKLQQNFTTIEQSNRLLELGLPADSADLYSSLGFENLIWVRNTHSELREDFFNTLINGKSANIPIWSVGRLIEIICNCHIVTNQLMENWICCDKNTNLIELLIRDIEVYTNVQHIDFSKLEE